MNIRIRGYEEAEHFVPDEPTYAIRIFNSPGMSSVRYGNLQKSENYVAIKEYTFDDIGLNSKEGIPFNRCIARQIVEDFQREGFSSSGLIVHCTQGLSRSPAVAIALNKLFNLGQDHKKMIYENEHYHYSIYRMIVEEGEKFNPLST